MWRREKLKDICKVFADGNWIETKDQSEDGIRLVQTGNIKTGSFSDRIDKARFINEDTFKRLNCTEIFEGDLLVSRLPDPVGRACLIPELEDRAITAVDCSIIRLKDFILPEFACYFMQSSAYFSEVQKRVTGATRQRISRKNLGEILFPIPTLAEQQRIVAKLDAAFAGIDEAVEVTKNSLLNLRQFHEKFISDTLNTTANNWLTGSISDFCTIKSGSTVDKKFEVEAGDIAYLKVADMNISENQNSIVTSSRFLKANDVRKTQIIEAGSIIFPKRGGAILTNKKRITDVPICADLNLMSVKSNGSIHPKLLFYFFQNVDMRQLGSGSSIPQINNYDIEPLKISFPKDPAEQSALVIKLDDVSQTITGLSKTYETKVAALSSLKSAILAQELQSEAA